MSNFPCSHKSAFNKQLLTVTLFSEMLPGDADETKENQAPGTIPTNTFPVV